MSRERKILVWNVVLMLVLGVAALTLRLTRINRRPPILPNGVDRRQPESLAALNERLVNLLLWRPESG